MPNRLLILYDADITTQANICKKDEFLRLIQFYTSLRKKLTNSPEESKLIYQSKDGKGRMSLMPPKPIHIFCGPFFLTYNPVFSIVGL